MARRRRSGGRAERAPSTPEPTRGSSAATPDAKQALPERKRSVAREWADALVVAFVLAMFLRVFIVELFKIPTGSMTPTLIGGTVAEIDLDRDGLEDMLLLDSHQHPLRFMNNGERLVGEGPTPMPTADRRRLQARGVVRKQYDRILVNKFAHWFGPPARGEIVVFKTPPHIWERDKPIWIKRCVGRPGETLTFDADGHLLVDDERVTEPEFFATQSYLLNVGEARRPEEIDYARGPDGFMRIERIEVPEGEAYVFGDNTWSSRDSRYWGGVPLENLKGRAFFRYVPVSRMKFLNTR